MHFPWECLLQLFVADLDGPEKGINLSPEKKLSAESGNKIMLQVINYEAAGTENELSSAP
jgi:hypothetical protein